MDDEELAEEKSFKASDLDDETFVDDIDEPLEPLEDGVDLGDDEEEDPDSNFH